MRRYRNTVIGSAAAALIGLALVGAAMWPTDTPEPASVSAEAVSLEAVPTTSHDSGIRVVPSKEDRDREFNAALQQGGGIYNCPENSAAKTLKDISQLVPCGTDMVLVTWNGNDANTAPTVEYVKGDGDDSVVKTTFDPAARKYESDVLTGPSWYVKWTVGERSELLQVYEQYRCGDGSKLCWAPTTVSYMGVSPDGYRTLDLSGWNTKIAFVFSDYSRGSEVPGEWWGKNDPISTFNLRY